jgi:hypothetical protein
MAEFPAHLEQGILEAHQGKIPRIWGTNCILTSQVCRLRLLRASDSGGVISITQSTAILQREAL